MFNLPPREKSYYLLRLAKKGEFGTPDNQNRLSSGRGAFWRCYEGADTNRYKNTIIYPYALAGRDYAKEKQA